MWNPQWWMVGVGFMAGWICRSQCGFRAVSTPQGAFHIAVNAAVARTNRNGATGGMLAPSKQPSQPINRTEGRKD